MLPNSMIHNLSNYTKWGNLTHRYMLEPIPLFAIQTIASMRLSSHALRCETGVRAQVMRVVDYAHFALNKFESLSITLLYNALPLIIFDNAFPTSLTKPNAYTKFSHNHNMHSRLQHSLVKFLNIEIRYSLSHLSREM